MKKLRVGKVGEDEAHARDSYAGISFLHLFLN